jgi:hypothetical protein
MVFMSAGLRVREAAVQHAADDYLGTPLTVDELLRLVARCSTACPQGARRLRDPRAAHRPPAEMLIQ